MTTTPAATLPSIWTPSSTVHVLSGHAKRPSAAASRSRRRSRPSARRSLVRADLFANGLSAEDLGVMMNGGSGQRVPARQNRPALGGERPGPPAQRAANGSWQFANIDAVTSEGALQVNATAQPDAAARILSAWASEQDPWLHGYWTYDWTDSYVGIANITAASNGAARMALEPFIPVNPDARFYGVNLLCELDAPGEYFINNANGTLYFYPPGLDDWGNSKPSSSPSTRPRYLTKGTVQTVVGLSSRPAGHCSTPPPRRRRPSRT